MEKAWKRAEKQVARFFGAERNPLSGGNSRISRSDSTHGEIYIETKYFSEGRFAGIESLFNVTAFNAKAEHKTPVICLKRHGKKGFLILLKESDLLDVAMYAAENRQRKTNPEEIK